MNSPLPIPILMYHRIGERVKASIVPDHYVPERLFESHIRGLKRRGFRIISLAELHRLFQSKAPNTDKLIAISFDDGFENFYTGGMPILKKHNVTASVFLVADCIGKTNQWCIEQGDVTERMMTVEQIQEGREQGVEFGSHTITHPNLPKCTDELAASEIVESKDRIEKMVGFPVDWFSYPYGYYGDRDKKLVEEAGYLGGLSTRRIGNTQQTDRFALGRINVRFTTSTPYLFYKLYKAKKKHV